MEKNTILKKLINLPKDIKSHLYLLLLLLLFSCSTITLPLLKEPISYEEGSSYVKLNDEVFKIGFNGNIYNDMMQADNFVLGKSAEVTLHNNYKYFIIKNEENHSVTTDVTSSHYNLAGSTYGSTYGSTIKTLKPDLVKIIICFNEKPKRFSYNAKELYENIVIKYKKKRLIQDNNYLLLSYNKEKLIKIDLPTLKMQIRQLKIKYIKDASDQYAQKELITKTKIVKSLDFFVKEFLFKEYDNTLSIYSKEDLSIRSVMQIRALIRKGLVNSLDSYNYKTDPTNTLGELKKILKGLIPRYSQY